MLGVAVGLGVRVRVAVEVGVGGVRVAVEVGVGVAVAVAVGGAGAGEWVGVTDVATGGSDVAVIALGVTDGTAVVGVGDGVWIGLSVGVMVAVSGVGVVFVDGEAPPPEHSFTINATIMPRMMIAATPPSQKANGRFFWRSIIARACCSTCSWSG